MLVPAVLVAGLAAYGVWETRSHRMNLARVPLRIHVNGTRGKSSVTRLISAGLRAGGIRTLGKTTGTEARLLLPDGSEQPVFQVGPPNVIEQTRVVARAAAAGAQALVVECMAVQPELQRFCEQRLIRSTVGVLTNVRPDHQDVMGQSMDEVEAALAETVPHGAVLFTAERARLGATLKQAASRKTRCVPVDPADVSEAELARFSYLEHPDNVAVALAVCQHLGVARGIALRGMRTAEPDPGALRRYVVREGHREMQFVNAFAANDPESTLVIWRRLGLDGPDGSRRTRIALVNARADRPQRSEQLAALIAGPLSAEHYVLSGQGTEMLHRRALELGLAPDRIRDLGGYAATDVYEHLLALTERRSIVVGIGNIVGFGEELMLHISNRDVSDAD